MIWFGRDGRRDQDVAGEAHRDRLVQTTGDEAEVGAEQRREHRVLGGAPARLVGDAPARVPARDVNDVAADRRARQPAGDEAAAGGAVGDRLHSALAGSDGGSVTVPSLATIYRACGAAARIA